MHTSFAPFHSCKALDIGANSPTRFATLTSKESSRRVERVECSFANERARLSRADERPESDAEEEVNASSIEVI